MTNRRSRKRRAFLANHLMCRVILPVAVLIAATLCLQQSAEANQRFEQVSERKQENIPNRSSLSENHQLQRHHHKQNHNQQQQQQQELFQKDNITSPSQANADYVTTTASTSLSSSSSLSTASSTLNHSLNGQTTPQASSTVAVSTEFPTTPTSNKVLSTTTATNLPTTTITTRDNVFPAATKQKQQQPIARQQVVNNKQEQNERIRQPTNSANLEPIDQMSTSRSATFAEPLMAASNQELRQRQYQPQVVQPPPPQQQQQLRGGNRWTHFGARLRPLTTIGSDHHGADSKSLMAISLGGQNKISNQNNNHNNNHHNNMQQAAQQRASVGQPLNGNQVGDQEDNEDVDDDQDSEALLYKMMQQQGFLTGSIWQQNQPQSHQQQGNGQNGAVLSSNDASGNQLVQDAPSNGMVGGNSKRVIKLLKSYSHIHQVDDSDDQIRGTYTRVPAHRLNGLDQNNNNNNNNNNAWRAQPTKQQYNRNRLNTNGQQPRPVNHIFVSSQPLTRAYSQQTGRHQEAENYPPLHGNANQGIAYVDGPNGGQDGDANLAANQDGGDQSGQPSEEDDFECPNNGIFADEASGCQAYHVCQSGAQVQQKFQCPMGTLFNNIILTCDFAHNVQCKGKAQQEAAKAQSVANEETPASEPPAPIPRQYPIPQQQIPRASIQVDQASYVNEPQQQVRWSQAAAYKAQQASSNDGGGPRQLRIGQSQYSQHQQNQQSSLAQAVSAYPHPQPAVALTSAPNNNNNDSDDDSDDDPVEPLVPATLPPTRANSQPAYTQGQSAAIQIINHQTAHRSQYPTPQQQHQAYQQNAMTQTYPQANNGYDGDSASSPIFVNRDEPRTTEATINAITNLHSVPIKQQQQQQGDAQSFNLVINHLAPTRQQQSPSKNAIIKQQQQVPVATSNLESSNNVNNKKLSLQSSPKQNHLVSTNQQQNTRYTGLVPNNKKLMDLKQQQQQQFASINNKLVAINAQAQNQQQQQQLQRANQLRQQQHYANQNSYHQASQPKSVHVDARPVGTAAASTTTVSSAAAQKSLTSPSIVDLTNDKRASISSEAINDGLLLIVRHGTSYSGGSNPQLQQAATSSYNKGSTQQQVNYKPNSQIVRHSSKQHVVSGGDQAFAIDPSAVRANSPIDAQLFPNVQRVLAASQASVSHQAPPYSSSSLPEASPSLSTSSSSSSSSSSPYLQHAAYKKQQQHQTPNRQEIRISPPLLPMEPPKPSSYANSNDVNDQYSNSERVSSSEAVQVVASSSQTPSTTPPQQPTVATAALSPPQSSTTTTTTTTTTIPSQPALTSQNQKVSQNKQLQKRDEKKENQIKLKPKRLKAQKPPTQPQKSLERQESRSQANQDKPANTQQQQQQQQPQKAELSFGSNLNDNHQSRRLESGATRSALGNTNSNKRQASH